jgi:23S rRNA pseudouridine2605 synthase
MQERLQKIIARAGIASRRHAELLISSGQVLVNGHVVTELGTKADPATDRIEAAGQVIGENERPVYLILNKPPEVMSTLADPEGRKTLRNLLRGFPLRVYPVGNLEYAASGLIFLTNDGDLAAQMIKEWANLEQVYHIKVKGMLMIADLDRLGKEIGAKMETLRQPDATRGHSANFWYEVTMRDSKKEILRRVLFKEMHPLEKMKRIALGPLTLEGIPRGRYRMLEKKEIEALKAGKFSERPAPILTKRAPERPAGQPPREKFRARNYSKKPFSPSHAPYDDRQQKKGRRFTPRDAKPPRQSHENYDDAPAQKDRRFRPGGPKPFTPSHAPAGNRPPRKDSRFTPRGAKPAGAKNSNRRFSGKSKKNFKPRP